MEIVNLTYLTNVFEVAAAIMATLYFGKYEISNEKYFLYFLWFTVFVELAGAFWGYIFTSTNFWIYNIYIWVSFLFYLNWYFRILELKALKLTVLVFSVIFTIVAFWYFVKQPWDGYHEYSFVTGAFFTMICTIFHFRQLLSSDEVLILKNKLSFWISTGLLLFNMGMIPLMLLSNYFNFANNRYYGIVILVLNFILYGCYIIGFKWTKEKYNRF